MDIPGIVSGHVEIVVAEGKTLKSTGENICQLL